MKNPKLISKPFAQNGQKNVIPEKYETSMESNQATWDQGFGQIAMLPVSAGGLPPKGQDFNGILNQMCETIVHISKGGVFKFSADYATAINGYPKGAILQSEDEKKYYQSLIDNNKVNFNTASQDQIKTSWKLVMTDDLLDQLSKKLESSAVVQSAGTSTTSVISQKASTDLINELKSESNRTYYKRDDSPVFNEISAKEIRVNGINVALSGQCYTKSESESRYQPKGDYATQQWVGSIFYKKNDNPTFSVILATSRVDAPYFNFGETVNYGRMSYTNNVASFDEFKNGEMIASLKHPQTSGIIASQEWVSSRFYKRDDSPVFNEISAKEIRVNGINVALSGQCYTKSESESRYQPKGDYALKLDLINVDNIPVGSPIPWSLSTAPAGYLICQGQTFNKATYPKLAIAHPSGRLPDLRGEFIRGADSGRGVDTGREVLSSQTGNSLLSARGMGGNSEFSLKMSSGSVGTDNQGQREIYQQIEGQNRNETRPRNIAFLYIVRAA